MSWRASRRVFARVQTEQVRTALGKLTNGAEVLFVHSSLSSCGHVAAGPGGLLRILQEFCNTFVQPTFTYCYPASPGEAGPLFDPKSTPSQTGLLTEVFRHQDGAVRSIHATHSVAASGALADPICADHHRRDAPCGVDSPFDRLVRHRASVLLFGVTFHSYTLFHTAEDASGSEYAYEKGTLDRLRVVDERGEQQDCWSRRQSRTPRRFEEAGALFERAGLARRVKLGEGTLTLVPDCSKTHDFMVERLKRTPDFLYQSCARDLQ